MDLARHLDPHDDDRVARETAQLGLRVAAADRIWHAALDALLDDLRAFAATARRRETVQRRPARQIVRAAQGAAFAGWLALWAPGCSNNSGSHDSGNMIGDPDASPRDAAADRMIADVRPPDAGRPESVVYDPLPPDAGRRESVVYDPLPSDAGRPDLAPDRIMIVDPLPPDAGRPDTSGQPEGPQMVSDPPVAPSDALSLSPRTTEVGSH